METDGDQAVARGQRGTKTSAPKRSHWQNIGNVHNESSIMDVAVELATVDAEGIGHRISSIKEPGALFNLRDALERTV